MKQNLFLIMPTLQKCDSIFDLGDILLRDIDRYLDSLDEKMQDIFQCRWGFVESELTLEELGSRYKVSRERIRQHESGINSGLLKTLSLQPESIWALVQPELDFNLPEKILSLSSCFDTENHFYRFISFITGEKDLSDLIRPIIDPHTLKLFFLEHGPNGTRQQVINYLTTELDIAPPRIPNILLFLQKNGVISINNDLVRPLSLTQHEAIACTLCEYPNGLPWLDTARLTNIYGISRNPISETRLSNAVFCDSDLVYLSGKGIYKHTKFINLDQVKADAIIQTTINTLKTLNRKTMHLNEIYTNSLQLKEHNYYTTRYIVKRLGLKSGIYFSGKSQTDTISLEKEFQSVTQRDVILQAMHDSGKPLTKSEIAALLKSNSLDHASVYIDELMNEMVVVQIDRMLYTTLDIAYKNINLPKYMDAIRAVLEEESRPVDPSYLQLKLNSRLDQSYSKYFYASIARVGAEKLGWERRLNLFSVSNIPYSSLTNAIATHCQQSWSNDVNYKVLISHISITEDAANISISNWRASLARTFEK